MGVVYRGRDLNLDREVALKRPLSGLLERPGFRELFIAEARTASKLMHPNITTVFEVFEKDGVPWMVMELIDGGSLRSLLDGRNPIPFENTLRLAEGLTDALRVAHLGGVLHRDINPNNILVGGDGRARLSDFGLARARAEVSSDEPASEATTETISSGQVFGTRGYMSPEQALGKPLDARTDIFSLGVVLYEMCAGRQPFVRSDSGDWLDALLHREPQPISQLNSDIPIEFREIIQKALAKRRFQRYQSANEMLLDVRATRKRLESDIGSSSPSIHRMRRRIARGITVGGVVVAVTAAVVWTLVRSPRSPALPSDWSSRRVTREPGWEAEPAVSPDGSLITYSSNASGNADIWLVEASGGTPLRLTDHPASDRSPTWFPDGSAIAFFSDRSGVSGIWKIPALGGDPVPLVSNGSDPAVSPDGSSIAFAVNSPSGVTRIGVAPFEDPMRVSILTGDDDGIMGHRCPSWSPDGKTICYSDFRDLWLVSVDGGPARRLTSQQGLDRSPAWSGDGNFIFFSSARGGTRAIWWVAARGGVARRFTSGTGPEVSPSLSRDGDRLTYTTFVEELGLVIVDRRNGQRWRMLGSSIQSLPAIAPDGSGIAYAVESGDRFDLWFQPFSEEGPGIRRRLTDHPVTVATPTFSPDGSWIAFFGVLNQQRDIWTVPAAGGVPQRFTDNEAADVHPAFSVDGTLLAFSSTRADGRPHIWVARIVDGARAGDAYAVTSGEGMELFPAWSNDGKSLAYLVTHHGHADVWIIGLDQRAEPRQITDDVEARYVRWGEDGESLLVSGVWEHGRVELRRVSIEDGRTESLETPVEFGEENALGLFSVSSDGRLICHYEEMFHGDVWMLELE